MIKIMCACTCILGIPGAQSTYLQQVNILYICISQGYLVATDVAYAGLSPVLLYNWSYQISGLPDYHQDESV